MLRLVPLLLLATMSAAAAEPVSGRYSSADIVVRDGEVLGVFQQWRLGNGTFESPQFSCIFLMRGRLDGTRGSIVSWFPGEDERIGGTLREDADGLSLQLAENHGGCSMTTGDMVREPFPIEFLDAQPDWIDVGLVTAERAILQTDPAPDAQRSRPYLVEFDAIAALERRDGWTLVEYRGEDDRVTKGWLPDSDIALAGDGPGE
jgi:hypothetical protein